MSRWAGNGVAEPSGSQPEQMLSLFPSWIQLWEDSGRETGENTVERWRRDCRFCLVLNRKALLQSYPACFLRKRHIRVEEHSGFLVPGAQSLETQSWQLRTGDRNSCVHDST